MATEAGAVGANSRPRRKLLAGQPIVGHPKPTTANVGLIVIHMITHMKGNDLVVVAVKRFSTIIPRASIRRSNATMGSTRELVRLHVRSHEYSSQSNQVVSLKASDCSA